MQKKRMPQVTALQIAAIMLVVMLQGACSHVNPVNQSPHATTSNTAPYDSTPNDLK